MDAFKMHFYYLCKISTCVSVYNFFIRSFAQTISGMVSLAIWSTVRPTCHLHRWAYRSKFYLYVFAFYFQLKYLFSLPFLFFFACALRLSGLVRRWSILVFHIFTVAYLCWPRRNTNPKYHYWHFCCHFRQNFGLRYSHRWILQPLRWPFTNGLVHSAWIHGDDNVAKILVYHPVS